VFTGLHRAWDAPARARWADLSAPAGPLAWPARS
jgi:hypothetical protein